MKIHALRPARAACAATALAKLPVDAQPIVSSPKAAAALIAVATTRSLKDSDGCETASFLTQTWATPSRAASRGASTSGAPRSRHAWAVHGLHRRRDRAGPDTARRSRRGLGRTGFHRRGTPAAGAAMPPVGQRWSSWRGLHRRRRCTLARRVYQRFLGRIDRVAVLGARERAGAHVARVGTEGTLDGSPDFRIPSHEPRCDLTDEVPQHVVRDDELPVHVWPGTDPVDQDTNPFAHERGGLGGHRLEQNCEGTSPLERLRVTQ